MRHAAPLRVLFALALLVPLLSPASRAASRAPARGDKAMAVTAHPAATAAALQILKQGGNAIDAAVAAVFAISVVEPFSAGIGGGGFALVHQAKGAKTRALDFRERAPLAAHRDLYLDGKGKALAEASVNGHRAAAVPGTVAGMVELLQQGGQLSLAQVLAPAIDLAERGFVVSPRLHGAIAGRLEDLLADPGARDAFLVDGKPPEVGDLLLQRDLAETLRVIARDGRRGFYAGEIAQALVGDMTESGGLITQKDLDSYRPVWRKPEWGSYRGLRFAAMPLPSSGGLLLREILGLLERDATASREFHDVRSLHTYIEACRRAYADRARELGDPAFLRQPTSRLVAAKRLDRLYRSIDPARSTPSSALADGSIPLRPDPQHTSHLAVVDATGNAVALTFTVNTMFGAAVVVPGTGVLLNNEMDDFSVKPGQPNSYGLVGNEANAIAPAKIPLSSMTPTLVFEGNKLRLALGSPGGSTIITTVLQILINVVDHGMDVAAAVAAPRVHHQWLPDEVFHEPRGLDPETRRVLAARGHKLVERQPWGNAMAIEIKPDGSLEGAADPRGEGEARGL